MTAEEARNITKNTDDSVSVAPIMAAIEQAARSGFYYLDAHSLSLKQVAILKKRGFLIEEFGNQFHIKWFE